jgi:GH24 family phage-related lysozyme (muramidase)
MSEYDDTVNSILNEGLGKALAAGVLGTSLSLASPTNAAVDAPPQSISQTLTKQTLNDFVKHWEGFEPKVYKDSLGYKSIGYGFNLERAGAKETIEKAGLNYDRLISGKSVISKKQATLLMKNDVRDAVRRARRFVTNFDQLPHEAQMIVADMSYNLGNKLSDFKKMKAALESNDFKRAAYEARDSDWYEQVGLRSEHHVRELANLK